MNNAYCKSIGCEWTVFLTVVERFRAKHRVLKEHRISGSHGTHYTDPTTCEQVCPHQPQIPSVHIEMCHVGSDAHHNIEPRLIAWRGRLARPHQNMWIARNPSHHVSCQETLSRRRVQPGGAHNLRAVVKEISGDTRQLRFTNLHHFKQEQM